MPSTKLTPEMKALVEKIVADLENGKTETEIFRGEWSHKFEEPPLKQAMMKKGRLTEDFNDGVKLPKFDFSGLKNDYESLFEDLLLTPEERAGKVQERSAALADAFQNGTAAPATIMKPLNLRRGFIVMGTLR